MVNPRLRLGFIGLGVMGYPMAGHLASAGHAVTVFNRTEERAQDWCQNHTGRWRGTAAQAAEGCDLVFACVGADADVEAVTTGPDGAFQTMSSGTIFVDHTTASATIARQLYEEAKERGFHFIDAPVSGGEAGAQNGVLTVMAGGDKQPFEHAAPIIDAYAANIRLLGGPGSGQMTKMVNQICIAGLIEALAEGLNFAISAGLDASAVIDVISKGAAQSWQMDNRAKTMIEGEYEFGFAVDWMRKDLGIAFAEAKRMGIELPVAEIVDQYYEQVQEIGGGRNDTSSLLRRYREPQILSK